MQLTARRAAALATLTALVVWHRQVTAAALPFILAFLLAGLLEPMVAWLQDRLHLPRPAASAVALLAASAGAGYLALMAGARFLAELADAATHLPAYQTALEEAAALGVRWLSHLFEGLPPGVADRLRQALDQLAARLIGSAGAWAEQVLAAVSALPAAAAVLVVALLASFFMSRDRDLIRQSLLAALPRRWQPAVQRAAAGALRDLLGYCRAQCLLAGLTAAVSALGLLWLGTPYWLSLALLAGLLDLLPVLSPSYLYVPWALLAWVLGDPGAAVAVLALCGTVLALRQVVQAPILGHSTGLHPLVMLVALYAGAIFLGLNGLLLGPVLAIVAKAAYDAGLYRLLAGALAATFSGSQPAATRPSHPQPPLGRPGSRPPSAASTARNARGERPLRPGAPPQSRGR